MKGYSLLELLIVVSIIGIVTLFAAPALSFLLWSTQATTQVNQLVRLLNYARVLAIIDAKPVMLCPSSGNAHECGSNWAEGINVYIKNKLVRSMSSFPHAELNWNRASNKIIFAANGLLQSQNGSFKYSLTHKQVLTKHVILSSTGRIKVK